MAETARERLSRALRQANAPREMVEAAEAGYFCDMDSPIAKPKRALYSIALEFGLTGIAEATKRGDFNTAPWEWGARSNLNRRRAGDGWDGSLQDPEKTLPMGS